MFLYAVIGFVSVSIYYIDLEKTMMENYASGP